MKTRYYCEKCGREFSDIESCKQHERWHGEDVQIPSNSVIKCFSSEQTVYEYVFFGDVSDQLSAKSTIVRVNDMGFVSAISFDVWPDLSAWKRNLEKYPEIYKLQTIDEIKNELKDLLQRWITQFKFSFATLGLTSDILSEETKSLITLALKEKWSDVNKTISSSVKGGTSERVFTDIKGEIETAIKEIESL